MISDYINIPEWWEFAFIIGGGFGLYKISRSVFWKKYTSPDEIPTSSVKEKIKVRLCEAIPLYLMAIYTGFCIISFLSMFVRPTPDIESTGDCPFGPNSCVHNADGTINKQSPVYIRNNP